MRMKRWLAVSLLLGVCSILLVACWDEVNLQDQSYIAGIGVDYEANSKTYTVYAQLVDMSTVAKQVSTGSSNQSAPYYVGKATGKSPYLALQHLSKTMPLPPSLDQLHALLISESAMPRMNDILDSLNRNRAVRYTVQVTGTSEKLEDVFRTDTFFGRSVLTTALYNPGFKVDKHPFSRIADLQHFVRSYRDPATAAFIPQIRMNGEKWGQDGKKIKLPYLSGAFAFRKGEYAGTIPSECLQGARWFHTKMKDMEIPLIQNKAAVGSLSVVSVKKNISYLPDPAPGKFRMTLFVRTHLKEKLEELTNKKMSSLAEQAVKKQIDDSVGCAASKRMDLFKWEEKVYRRHSRIWKKQQRAGIRYEKLPVSTEIHIHVQDTGKLK